MIRVVHLCYKALFMVGKFKIHPKSCRKYSPDVGSAVLEQEIKVSLAAMVTRNRHDFTGRPMAKGSAVTF